jgi:hypothetical protein
LELTTGNLLDTDAGKLLLLFIKDLDELGLVLVTEFVSFDGNLFNNVHLVQLLCYILSFLLL